VAFWVPLGILNPPVFAAAISAQPTVGRRNLCKLDVFSE
jgi:hypothetical protein